MLREFKKFILRGNVVDLAVGVAIGAAFTGVVNALVKDIITPLATAIYGGQEFTNAKFIIRGSSFLYGDLINAAVSFTVVAVVIFFLVVQPINKLTERFGLGKSDDLSRKCPYCLGKIPEEASRCMFCTSEIQKEK